MPLGRPWVLGIHYEKKLTKNIRPIDILVIYTTLQISIGWLSVISSVIPLALKVILPIHIIPIGKIL